MFCLLSEFATEQVLKRVLRRDVPVLTVSSY